MVNLHVNNNDDTPHPCHIKVRLRTATAIETKYERRKELGGLTQRTNLGCNAKEEERERSVKTTKDI